MSTQTMNNFVERELERRAKIASSSFCFLFLQRYSHLQQALSQGRPNSVWLPGRSRCRFEWCSSRRGNGDSRLGANQRHPFGSDE